MILRTRRRWPSFCTRDHRERSSTSPRTWRGSLHAHCASSSSISTSPSPPGRCPRDSCARHRRSTKPSAFSSGAATPHGKPTGNSTPRLPTPEPTETPPQTTSSPRSIPATMTSISASTGGCPINGGSDLDVVVRERHELAWRSPTAGRPPGTEYLSRGEYDEAVLGRLGRGGVDRPDVLGDRCRYFRCVANRVAIQMDHNVWTTAWSHALL